MTQIYTRWMDVSTRLISIMDVTDARRDKILKAVQGFIRRFEDEEIHGWDKTIEYKFHGRYCIGSIANDSCYFGEFWQDWKDKQKERSFYNQLCTVTKAGLDVATQEWGGGVVGYTIGDLRKAYERCIPDWICSALELTGDEDDEQDVWL